MGYCSCSGSFLFLIAGILFLLQDLAIWDFWNLSWYTVLFILVGLGFFAGQKCRHCQVSESVTAPKPATRKTKKK